MSMKIFTIAIAFYMAFYFLLMSETVQSESFEKQALATVQRMTADELDSKLPKSPVVTWFKQLVGPQAGIIWQLSECGGPIATSGGAEPDIPACVEANAVLQDGSKVVVVITVGTFKKGLAGQPAFFRAVVEHNYQLNLVRSLHDLPAILRAPGNRSIQLPDIGADLTPIKLVTFIDFLPIPTDDSNPMLADLADVDAPPLPQTTPKELQPKEPQLIESQPKEPQKVKESVLLGNAISKVMPVYPASARGMNAFGEVVVQVTVSERGEVIAAKAISGHPALRTAAVEAARRWVFKPTTLNGLAVKVQSFLTFVFSSRTQ